MGQLIVGDQHGFLGDGKGIDIAAHQNDRAGLPGGENTHGAVAECPPSAECGAAPDLYEPMRRCSPRERKAPDAGGAPGAWSTANQNKKRRFLCNVSCDFPLFVRMISLLPRNFNFFRLTGAAFSVQQNVDTGGGNRDHSESYQAESGRQPQNV